MAATEKVHSQSFEKGMNKDINTESSQGFYYDCHNLRINAVQGSQFAGLTNDIRNALLTNLPSQHIPIGVTKVRDNIIIFTTQTTDLIGGQGWIYELVLNKEDGSFNNLILKYTNIDLKFSTAYPIEALGYYENEHIQRVYWSDYFNKTRSINLATIQITDNIEATSLFVETLNKAPIINEVISGGSLPVGIYEYFYLLTTVDGKETLYSPNSIQTHIVEDLESVSNSGAYFGSLAGITNKAIKVNVDTQGIPNIFSKITLCAIYKANYNDLPTVLQIEEKSFINNFTVVFTHSNNELSLSQIDYDYYLDNKFPFYTNKTFAIQDNNLTASNIKTEAFDLNWDTQCYRFKLVDSVAILHPPYKNYFNDESGTAYGDRPSGAYTDWLNEDQYMYQSDGVTVGGQSLDQSIKYKFILKEIGTNDANSSINYFSDNPNAETNYSVNGQTIINKTFNSFHSPYLRSLKGYKDEEVYRFGIVGRKKNVYSFVGYIGDIKFPSISTVAGYETIAGTGIDTFPISRLIDSQTVGLYSLGIEFTINVPENVDIDGYEIVRVPRDIDNRTRMCSGVLTKFFEATDGSDGSGVHYPMSDINDIEGYYAGGTIYSPDGAIYWSNNQSEFDRKDLIAFYTPEANFNFEYPQTTGLNYLKVISILDNTTKYNEDTTDTVYSGQDKWGSSYPNTLGSPMLYRQFYTQARTSGILQNYNFEYHWEKIKAYELTAGGFGGDTPESIDGLNYRNYCPFINEQGEDFAPGAYSGKALICKMDAGDGNLFDVDNLPDVYYSPGTGNRPYKDYFGKVFLLDFVRLKQDQYGGIGIEALAYNNFISITNTITNPSATTEVFGGDIYTTYYEFMKTYWDNTNPGGDNASFNECVFLPIRSVVNIDLNVNRLYTRGSSYDHNGDGTAEHYRSQEDAMYSYNSVFSSEFMSRYYQTKPFDFVENTTYDVRTYLSDPKIIGESVDSWTKFRTNNFADAEANLGPINKTHSHLNHVFFLQDNGVGYININPKAIVSTTDGEVTKLGSGEGFQGHVYISKEKGCIHQFASRVIENQLYFFDANKQVLNKLNGTQPENLSTVKGMDSFFKTLVGQTLLNRAENGDNCIQFKGVHMGWDREHNELYITILGNIKVKRFNGLLQEDVLYEVGDIIFNEGSYYVVETPFDAYLASINPTFFATMLEDNCRPIDIQDYSYTVVYSPDWDSFRAFYGFKPSIYLENSKYLVTPNPDNQNILYIHNQGENGVLYDNDPIKSSIEFFVNDMPILTKVLKVIKYDLTVKDVNGDYITDEGLDSIRITNEHQDTGLVSLTNRQRNIFNTWKIKRIPRNSLVANKISRLRNDYHKIALHYNNSYNRLINLERVFTTQVLQ